MKKKIMTLTFLAAMMIGASACAENQLVHSVNRLDSVKWQKIAPGIWKTVIGKADNIKPTDLAGEKPKLDALKAMGEVDFPLDLAECKGYTFDGKTAIRLPFGKNERMYGLGLQFHQINRQGGVYHLRTDYYHGGNDRTHAPVPFYVSSKGYGVLINSSRLIDLYAGTVHAPDDKDLPPRIDRTAGKSWKSQNSSSHMEASVNGDGVEVLLFAGPSALDAVRRYNLYNGGGTLPPKWGLGFWNRFHTTSDGEKISKDVEEFAAKDYPLEVVGLEPGWQNWSYPCDYVWSKKRFSDPKGFMDKMNGKGLKVNIWVNAYLHDKSPLYTPMLDTAGSHMMYGGLAPDYLTEAARQKFAAHMDKECLDLGVSGFKLDECDGGDKAMWPDHAMFPSGVNGERMRALYGLSFQKTVYDMYKKRNERTYGLVRASYAGASAYPFVLYSDHYKHKEFITALCNSSFCGILWTPEIRGVSNDEDSVRRMQAVCMSPLAMLNAWNTGAKPWDAGKEGSEAMRDVMKLRMSLLPYIYSAFADYHYKGTPPIRAMPLCQGYEDKMTVIKGELDDTHNPYELSQRMDKSDQWMLGDNILVAPKFAGGDKGRQVVLPAGKWYDFYTGKYVGEKETISINNVPLNQIPLFVKDGGIIPMIDAVLNSAAVKEGAKLTVRHYGKKPGKFALYDDDGKSFDYTRGEYAWINLEVKLVNGKLTGSHNITGKYESIYGDVEWKFMTK